MCSLGGEEGGWGGEGEVRDGVLGMFSSNDSTSVGVRSGVSELVTACRWHRVCV